MDEQTTQQPINDDQELAKVLAGVSGQADAVQADAAASEESTTTTPPVPETPVVDTEVEAPQEAASVYATPAETPASATTSGSSELDGIKLEALNELRPLVDKLNVSPEEKFDTYLLLLRSTDDKALIEPAHEAAKNIADETRRAQALLDIIKEIDFLSGPKQ